MVFEDRWYQIEAEDALMRDIDNYSPVIAVPTGGGKTKIMASFIMKYLEKNPFHNVLVMANTEDILSQNHAAICNFFPGINIGLYSSGLKSRTIEKITVAGIQSVYKKPSRFKHFHLAIIDECHTIPVKQKSMYRKFLNEIDVKCAGMSATVFRKGQGYIYEGENAIFDKLSYDLTSVDNFNRLVSEGYLCNLISKSTDLEMDTKKIKTTAGDFNQKQLSERFDREAITDAAVKELIEIGSKNYKSWLVFAIDINHADHINNKLNELGIKSKVLHTKMNGNRRETIDEFKNQEIRALVSVGMITTGFDAPNIDLIVLLRPTKSAVLHVQMVGRGLRTCSGKSHCLILDFAGNTKRLGPINDPLIPSIKGKGKKGSAPVKTCPDCGVLHATVVKLCNVCGHVFEFKQKITEFASNLDVIKKQVQREKKWLDVSNVYYKVNVKADRPSTLRVTYQCGINQINEYICLNHNGYARLKAENWVAFRWTFKEPKPNTVEELFEESHLLLKPRKIYVELGAKYPTILDVEFS